MLPFPRSFLTNHDAITKHTRDLKTAMLANVKKGVYFNHYPDPKQLQTPFSLHRHHTGMQSFEWHLLRYHVLKNWKIIAACYPNIEVVDERQIDYIDIPETPQRLLQPFIPRLDAALLSYSHEWILVEICTRLDCQTIGELIVKARIFQRRHHLGPKTNHIQVLYTNLNPIVEHEATFQRLMPDNIPLRLYRYDFNDIAESMKENDK